MSIMPLEDYTMQALYIPTATIKRLAKIEAEDMIRPTPTVQMDVAYVAGAAAAAMCEQNFPLPDSGPEWVTVKRSKLEELEMQLLSARASFTDLSHGIGKLGRNDSFDLFWHWQTWVAAAIIVLAGFLLSGVL